MKPKSAQRLAGVFLATLLTAGPVPADTVVLKGRPPFRNVQVVGFRQGQLVFRGVSKELLRKPLDEVACFKIDRDPMLSNAEALAARDPEAAIIAYQQALADATEPWLRDLIRVRLLGTCDRAGHFDDAVELYVELLKSQAGPADQWAPRHPAAPGSPDNQKARQRLIAAAGSSRSSAAIRALRTLALELLLFDEVEPLPEEFMPPASTPSASRPAEPTATTRPADVPRPLFGPPEAGGRAEPGPVGGEPEQAGGRLRLPDDSFVLSGARAAFEGGDAPRAARLLERAMPYLVDEPSYPWRLLLGRCQIELGQFARAADELLALSESATDPGLAAEALYYVGVAHERMDRADVAVVLYRELLQRPEIPAEVRRLAERGLERLEE
jgi:tetratricopeptide (TPR) repeat protein